MTASEEPVLPARNHRVRYHVLRRNRYRLEKLFWERPNKASSAHAWSVSLNRIIKLKKKPSTYSHSLNFPFQLFMHFSFIGGVRVAVRGRPLRRETKGRCRSQHPTRTQNRIGISHAICSSRRRIFPFKKKYSPVRETLSLKPTLRRGSHAKKRGKKKGPGQCTRSHGCSTLLYRRSCER